MERSVLVEERLWNELEISDVKQWAVVYTQLIIIWSVWFFV